jgi:nucleotide-binding universal stress UspA family protein
MPRRRQWRGCRYRIFGSAGLLARLRKIPHPWSGVPADLQRSCYRINGNALAHRHQGGRSARGPMKLTRILCPIDFSEASRHAIEHAVALAGQHRSHITALYALAPTTFALSEVAAAMDEISEPEHLRKCAEQEFACAAKLGIAVDALVDIGQPVDRILARAIELPADFIVMGTHGTSGFQRFVLGSVTEKVLRKASCPVFTVPPRAHATSQLPFTRLLCAVDFSEASLRAVDAAVSLARESNATLTLLHVLEWPWEEPPAPSFKELPAQSASALAEFRRYSEASAMQRLRSVTREADPACAFETRLSNGKPYAEILRVAADEQTDAIVIGVHGRNPLDMALFGSTTNQIVRRATCPVLTVRS